MSGPVSALDSRAEARAARNDEERLRAGKRAVRPAAARVRSYVEERPVSEQIILREEHVTVERRPAVRSS